MVLLVALYVVGFDSLSLPYVLPASDFSVILISWPIAVAFGSIILTSFVYVVNRVAVYFVDDSDRCLPFSQFDSVARYSLML